jgi:hypothetical protein
MSRIAFASLVIAATLQLTAQYLPRHTASPNAVASTGAYNEPAATMHGVLHKIGAKEIVIITEGDQSVTMVRTRKTKFLRNGKEIKPAEIALNSIVSVDVGKFADLTPQAVNVMVDAPPVDGASTTTKPASSPEQMDQETPAVESSSPAPEPAKQPPAKPASPPSR